MKNLVVFMRSQDIMVLRATASAMRVLSEDEDNSSVLRRAEVIPLLINALGMPDRELQDQAAGALSNIRKAFTTSQRTY